MVCACAIEESQQEGRRCVPVKGGCAHGIGDMDRFWGGFDNRRSIDLEAALL